jgi:hypothetical protein
MDHSAKTIIVDIVIDIASSNNENDRGSRPRCRAEYKLSAPRPE